MVVVVAAVVAVVGMIMCLLETYLPLPGREFCLFSKRTPLVVHSSIKNALFCPDWRGSVKGGLREVGVVLQSKRLLV